MTDRLMLRYPSGELVPLSDGAIALLDAMQQMKKESEAKWKRLRALAVEAARNML